jgi:anti-sigma factor RsiW
MDCREFRNKHVAFVDDLLPAVEMEAMQRHITACTGCARHNTAIRRSLLLVHNLPPIEPSPEFMARLNARLEQLGPTSRVDLVAPRPYLPSAGAVAALAAGILAVAYMAVETTHYYAPAIDSRVVPVTASASDLVPNPVATGAFVASVPTGIPVWPAVLMVGEAPMRFANMDFHESNATR